MMSSVECLLLPFHPPVLSRNSLLFLSDFPPDTPPPSWLDMNLWIKQYEILPHPSFFFFFFRSKISRCWWTISFPHTKQKMLRDSQWSCIWKWNWIRFVWFPRVLEKPLPLFAECLEMGSKKKTKANHSPRDRYIAFDLYNSCLRANALCVTYSVFRWETASHSGCVECGAALDQTRMSLYFLIPLQLVCVCVCVYFGGKKINLRNVYDIRAGGTRTRLRDGGWWRVYGGAKMNGIIQTLRWKCKARDCGPWLAGLGVDH